MPESDLTETVLCDINFAFILVSRKVNRRAEWSSRLKKSLYYFISENYKLINSNVQRNHVSLDMHEMNVVNREMCRKLEVLENLRPSQHPQ